MTNSVGSRQAVTVQRRCLEGCQQNSSEASSCACAQICFPQGSTSSGGVGWIKNEQQWVTNHCQFTDNHQSTTPQWQPGTASDAFLLMRGSFAGLQAASLQKSGSSRVRLKKKKRERENLAFSSQMQSNYKEFILCVIAKGRNSLWCDTCCICCSTAKDF